MMEGSESVHLTNGSGSSETQKRSDPDSDAEHWFKGGCKRMKLKNWPKIIVLSFWYLLKVGNCVPYKSFHLRLDTWQELSYVVAATFPLVNHYYWTFSFYHRLFHHHG
jgi:hypothetical protein